MTINDATQTWLNAVWTVLTDGHCCAPRGQSTHEVLHQTHVVDMRRPVVLVPQRRLSYTFMAAEAYWILSGDDRVATIAPYLPRLAEFSDDGETFYGAYGPRIASQLDYVVAKLKHDPCTRQAGLTIWRENPLATKDVPCTVAIFFSQRKALLNAHVFMRSSDVWLGLPYDIFNFSMLAHLVCARLGGEVSPGTLYLTAASCHLYEINVKNALLCTTMPTGNSGKQQLTPPQLYHDQEVLMTTLRDLRETISGDPLRWWEL